MSDAISKYVIDRDNALKNLDIKEFTEFMNTHRKEISKSVVDKFMWANEIVKMATMCKMVVNIKGFRRTETYKKAAQWLKDHDMSKEIEL